MNHRRRSGLAFLTVCGVMLVSCSSGGTAERDPAATAVPVPSGSLPGGQSAEELTTALKGMSVADATAILEAAGWEVRSYDVDDPDSTVTGDFRPGRVTIGTRQGIVLGVEIG